MRVYMVSRGHIFMGIGTITLVHYVVRVNNLSQHYSKVLKFI